ncbi:dihydrofolate reductase family protein [Streptomyces sp. NPDC046332]|uniref:dihydrofolate reductase family protein n=1 Tax=Streptomyces sp. NPDC046332 TaxID=3155133 RepID=UPI0033CB8098
MAGGQSKADDESVRENFNRAAAYVMGRRTFDEGERGWPDPPQFRAPVFVLTSTPREPWVRQGGTTFTFVTEDVEFALARAREAAAGKDVQIPGGAHTVRQYLDAGLVDELQIHLSPIVLSKGVRLFDHVPPEIALEPTCAIHSPGVTHLTYQVVRP